MAYETKSSAPRTEDTSGDLQEIATFSENADGSGEQIQAIALTGAEGAKAGVPGLPLHVQGIVLTAIEAAQQAAATTPTIYNVTMTNADEEYGQALPANTKRFSLQCLTDFDVRFAFEAGKVAAPTAPYGLVRAGLNYYEDQVDLTGITLYIASPDAGKIAEIIAWA